MRFRDPNLERGFVQNCQKEVVLTSRISCAIWSATGAASMAFFPGQVDGLWLGSYAACCIIAGLLAAVSGWNAEIVAVACLSCLGCQALAVNLDRDSQGPYLSGQTVVLIGSAAIVPIRFFLAWIPPTVALTVATLRISVDPALQSQMIPLEVACTYLGVLGVSLFGRYRSELNMRNAMLHEETPPWATVVASSSSAMDIPSSMLAWHGPIAPSSASESAAIVVAERDVEQGYTTQTSHEAPTGPDDPQTAVSTETDAQRGHAVQDAGSTVQPEMPTSQLPPCVIGLPLLSHSPDSSQSDAAPRGGRPLHEIPTSSAGAHPAQPPVLPPPRVPQRTAPIMDLALFWGSQSSGASPQDTNSPEESGARPEFIGQQDLPQTPQYPSSRSVASGTCSLWSHGDYSSKIDLGFLQRQPLQDWLALLMEQHEELSQSEQHRIKAVLERQIRRLEEGCPRPPSSMDGLWLLQSTRGGCPLQDVSAWARRLRISGHLVADANGVISLLDYVDGEWCCEAGILVVDGDILTREGRSGATFRYYRFV